MKVNCESCGKPITAQVNSLFEQFEPGRVVCPHCHHQQKRYISEADLFLLQRCAVFDRAGSDFLLIELEDAGLDSNPGRRFVCRRLFRDEVWQRNVV